MEGEATWEDTESLMQMLRVAARMKADIAVR